MHQENFDQEKFYINYIVIKDTINFTKFNFILY